MNSLLLALTLATAPQGDAAVVLRPTLGIRGIARGGRVAATPDRLAARRARGRLEPPGEGDTLPGFRDRERTWQTLEPDEHGRVPARAVRGGYAYARHDAERARTAMLAVRGCRHVLWNGEPRTGDVYDLGIVRLPVRVRAGANHLFLRGGRGRLGAVLHPVPGTWFFEARDATLPDVVRGEDEPLWAGVMLTNAGTTRARDLEVRVRAGDRHTDPAPLPALAPMVARKVPVRLPAPGNVEGDEWAVTLELLHEGGVVHEQGLTLRVRAPDQPHRRTFVSAIDRSVQYYAVRPGDLPEGERPALFLSLHGASVEAIGQARSYGPKSWGHVIAPTNRRPFGFDWEDWGRLDALEVLAEAERRFDPDPRRIHLTGHSMGGHGTWHLAVHRPGRFAAIAPSAGWRDFWSYGSGTTFEDPDPVEELLRRAANDSRTLLLEDNLRHCGIYVLHGTEDDNVPVGQARGMRARLGAFHRDFAYYERPGAGHWWGRECVDWPPLFDFLRHHRLPTGPVHEVAFSTVHPGILATCHWVTVVQQHVWNAPTRVDLAFDPEKGALSGSTSNAARLRLELAQLGGSPDAPLQVGLDEGDLETPWPAAGVLHLERPDPGGAWQVAGAAGTGHKRPVRAGPFLDAFRRGMVLVYGTAGTREENDWAAAKARLDLETFWYRGNGSMPLIADTGFDPADHPGRNVILYGHAEMNAAWDLVLDVPADRIRRNRLQIGGRSLEGDDLALLFVAPRRDDDTASVGVIAGTGVPGLRATDLLPVFVSGAGYPDWLVLGGDVLDRGTGGVRGAGYFDRTWNDGESAWR